jgi:hypothetical protein
MRIYYRISDKNRRGKAPEYFTNKNCLNNFIHNFKIDKNDEFIIIADNVTDETYNWLLTYNKPIVRTQLGNSGSFNYCLNDVINSQLNDEDIVYFVENDYLHIPGSREILDEAFHKFGAEYVSLYDSPEKYDNHYNINYKSYVHFGQNLFKNFKSLIYCGSSCYWRTTETVTITFASRVKFIKLDYQIFYGWMIDLRYEDKKLYPLPGDYEIFRTISRVRERKILTPMPGAATHGDLLSPHVDWSKYVIKKIEGLV